ncbi:glutathione S-transferase C-terminal domain-containing protein [Pseudomonas sp. NPDC086251]|uniref:glutathione S-transferase C-terminal domain-containing protein n=1 Tax=Pseudomonas sp. NPDC086251 TaxID=3364431 RepID=UPI003835FE62
MKLFIQAGSGSLSPQIIANEIGIELELFNVDMAAQRYGENEYYKVSTFSMVPALVIDDKKTLHETAVISVYLADKKPAAQLVPYAGTFERVRVMEMLSFVTGEIHQKFIPLLPTFVNSEAKDEFRTLLSHNLTHLDKQLSDGRLYMMGGPFGVVDAYLISIVPWVVRTKVDIEHLAHLQSYMDRLLDRPSVIKAMRDEGANVTDWRLP